MGGIYHQQPQPGTRQGCFTEKASDEFIQRTETSATHTHTHTQWTMASTTTESKLNPAGTREEDRSGAEGLTPSSPSEPLHPQTALSHPGSGGWVGVGSWGVESIAWTKPRDRPGQGGGKGKVSEEPATRQEEAATEPGELVGCGWTWGQGRAAKGKSSSRWTEAAAGGLRACLFSTSGDVSVSPQGRASDHSFYFLCSLSKEN